MTKKMNKTRWTCRIFCQLSYMSFIGFRTIVLHKSQVGLLYSLFNFAVFTILNMRMSKQSVNRNANNASQLATN